MKTIKNVNEKIKVLNEQALNANLAIGDYIKDAENSDPNFGSWLTDGEITEDFELPEMDELYDRI